MLGIPRPDFPELASTTSSAEPSEPEPLTEAASESDTAPDTAPQSHRARARVRYDSANEPFPMTQRRTKALRGLAVLVLLAAAWLGYRFLTVNG